MWQGDTAREKRIFFGEPLFARSQTRRPNQELRAAVVSMPLDLQRRIAMFKQREKGFRRSAAGAR